MEEHHPPIGTGLDERVNAWETGLQDGTIEWSSIQPSSTLVEIRQTLMQWLQQSESNWSPGQVARTAARIELSWKAERLGQMIEELGQSDQQVIELQQDITYWQNLLDG